MNVFATLLILFVGLPAAFLLWAAIKRAPRGYEDEQGFHLGTAPGHTAEFYVSGNEASREGGRKAVVRQDRREHDGARPPWPLAERGFRFGTARPRPAKTRISEGEASRVGGRNTVVYDGPVQAEGARPPWPPAGGYENNWPAGAA
jgi:hypothetical protein